MADTKQPGFVVGERVTGEVITVYAAFTEEYEKSEVASYHLTEHDARIGASGRGYSGPDGKVEPFLAIRLSDGRYVLAPEIIEIADDPTAEAKLREQAIKKLTPAELAAFRGRS